MYYQEKSSEAPAPAAASTSSTASAESSNTTPDTASSKSHKKKSRESLSISSSTKEKIKHNMEDKPTAAAATTPAAPSTPVVPMDGGYHGLPQVGSPPSALRELPALRDAPPNKREELFKLKLQLCGVIFSFDDPTSDKRGKVCFYIIWC